MKLRPDYTLGECSIFRGAPDPITWLAIMLFFFSVMPGLPLFISALIGELPAIFLQVVPYMWFIVIWLFGREYILWPFLTKGDKYAAEHTQAREWLDYLNRIEGHEALKKEVKKTIKNTLVLCANPENIGCYRFEDDHHIMIEKSLSLMREKSVENNLAPLKSLIKAYEEV